MYAWSSEVFATICAAIFFPVNLEQLARENGVYAFDRTTPCTTNLGNITDPSVNSTMFFSMADGVVEDKNRCVIHFLGLTWMDSSSFALYTFSISTFLQTILVISMSGAADYGTFICLNLIDGYRKLSKNVFDIVFLRCVGIGGGIRYCRCGRSNSVPPRLSLCHQRKRTPPPVF